MDNKSQEIHHFLDKIEQQYQISIISAIESGSRAWGFPSKDSDYDIRLIYHHPTDWYLSAFHKRNVIENIFDGDLDAAGWDISKCLQLLYKGNAPLYEWLHSPIGYRKNQQKLDLLRELANQAFNPKIIFYHYISLAKKKLLDSNTQHKPKAFLYGLRALLCAQWIAHDTSIPPVDFHKLTERYLRGSIKEDLTQLLLKKSTQSEQDENLISQALWQYAHNLLTQLRESRIPTQGIKTQETYDNTLREILRLQ